MFDIDYDEASLQSALITHSKELTDMMHTLLPEPNDQCESRLYEAMRYSVFSRGKRLRPFLVAQCAALFGVSQESALRIAAAIEFVHTYSLVHDDLPAMDDDDMRRGQPSCHVQFDDATAILAGDALLSLAFEVVTSPSTHRDVGVRVELAHQLAVATGCHGLVGGQMCDMQASTDLTVAEVTRLQRMKTGELFSIACEAGAILGKAPPHYRKALKAYAHSLGLAFQISDDLLDEISDAQKRVNKSENKATFVSLLGVEKSHKQMQVLVEQSIAMLNIFDESADSLRALARYIGRRASQ